MTSRFNDITSRLDREWHLLRCDDDAIARARTWSTEVDPSFGDLLDSINDLQDLVAATQADRYGADRLLTELIDLARHDQLAGQLVIRRLLPGTLAAVRRYRDLCDHSEPVSEAIGALWIAVRSFDAERRPQSVAAALISDAMYLAFRRQVRLRSSGELPAEPSAFAEHPASQAGCAFLELAEVIAEARVAGVPAGDLELLRQLVRSESPGLLARQRNVTPRTIRNHRDRAIHRVHRAVTCA